MDIQNIECFFCGDPEDAINPIIYELTENTVDEKIYDVADIQQPKNETADAQCDFFKDIDFEKAENYDQFGTEEFEIVVCGYFSSNQ